MTLLLLLSHDFATFMPLNKKQLQWKTGTVMEKYRDFSHLPFPAFPSLLFTPSLVAHQDVDLSPSHLSSFLVSILARAPSRSLSWLTHIFTFFVLIIGWDTFPPFPLCWFSFLLHFLSACSSLSLYIYISFLYIDRLTHIPTVSVSINKSEIVTKNASIWRLLED